MSKIVKLVKINDGKEFEVSGFKSIKEINGGVELTYENGDVSMLPGVKALTIRDISAHWDHEFKIVETIPWGCIVWNIRMENGYLPICTPLANYNIDGNTLKAIILDQSQIDLIESAVNEGLNSIDRIKKFISRNENSEKEYTLSKVERGRKALEILEKLS